MFRYIIIIIYEVSTSLASQTAALASLGSKSACNAIAGNLITAKPGMFLFSIIFSNKWSSVINRWYSRL